eukprot:TRINITY_DN24923_c0_g1_i1.p1 TRINITY_DN24923_c0_g1~~TRINITY_DN24923_c0_g1_i1.p1  ORF type:complete len:421 (+),score=12.41 TRINITY_DN24923_c0_g1_i1:111-1373(+)
MLLLVGLGVLLVALAILIFAAILWKGRPQCTAEYAVVGGVCVLCATLYADLFIADVRHHGPVAETNSYLAIHILWAGCPEGECSRQQQRMLCSGDGNAARYRLTCSDTRDLLCTRFEIVAKPLTVIWVMVTLSWAWGMVVRSSGRVRLPSLLWALFQFFGTLMEMVAIMKKVTDGIPRYRYPSEDGWGQMIWDRWEVCMWLFSQSTITMNVGSFLLARMKGKFSRVQPSWPGGSSSAGGQGLLAKAKYICCNEDYSGLLELQTRILVGIWVFLWILPGIFHYLSATLLWCWVLPFWFAVSAVATAISVFIGNVALAVINELRLCIQKPLMDDLPRLRTFYRPCPVVLEQAPALFYYMMFIIWIQTYMTYMVIFLGHGWGFDDGWLKAPMDEFHMRKFGAYFRCTAPENALAFGDALLAVT